MHGGAVKRWVDRCWFVDAPAERLGMLRVLVGLFATVYLLVRCKYLWSFGTLPADQFAPLGILSWMQGPIDTSFYQVGVVVTLFLSGTFLCGWQHRWLGPLFAAALWTLLTYTNSWGTILHTDNMLVLHVAVLALSPSADALSLDARQQTSSASTNARYGWPIRLICFICVAVYFIAGVAKLKTSGLAFISGDNLRNYVALANVRKIELGSQHSPLGVYFLEHARMFQVMAGASLALELGAPIAMVHRKLGVLWAVAMWLFHLGVLALMAIGFFYPLTFIAFAGFFRVEKLQRLRHR